MWDPIDDVEFSMLYRRYFGRILGMLQQRLGNRGEAEELAQEAFVRLYGELQAGKVLRPLALLRRIASNLATDHVRREAARRARESRWSAIRDVDERAPPSSGAPGDPARSLEGRQAIDAVLAALDELSRNVRDAFLLHRFYGYSHEEVAARLGLSRSTVEKHIMKAWRHLVARLEPGRGARKARAGDEER